MIPPPWFENSLHFFLLLQQWLPIVLLAIVVCGIAIAAKRDRFRNQTDWPLQLAATFSIFFGWMSLLLGIVALLTVAGTALWRTTLALQLQFLWDTFGWYKLVSGVLNLVAAIGLIFYGRRLIAGKSQARDNVLFCWFLALPGVPALVGGYASIQFFAVLGMAAWCFWALLRRRDALTVTLKPGRKIAIIGMALIALIGGIVIHSDNSTRHLTFSDISKSLGGSGNPYLERLILLPQPDDRLAGKLAQKLASYLERAGIPCLVGQAPQTLDFDREMALWIASGTVEEQSNFSHGMTAIRPRFAGYPGFRVETLYPHAQWSAVFKGLVLPNFNSSISGNIIVWDKNPARSVAPAATKLAEELLPLLKSLRTPENIRLPRLQFDDPLQEPLPGCRLLAVARSNEFRTFEIYSFPAGADVEQNRKFLAGILEPCGYRTEERHDPYRFSPPDHEIGYAAEWRDGGSRPWTENSLALRDLLLLVPERRGDAQNDPHYIREFFRNDPVGFAYCAGWRHLKGDERLTAMRDFFSGNHSVAFRLRVLELVRRQKWTQEEREIVQLEYRRLIAEITARQDSPEFISQLSSLVREFEKPPWDGLLPELTAALGDSYQEITIPKLAEDGKVTHGKLEFPVDTVWNKQMVFHLRFEDGQYKPVWYVFGVVKNPEGGWDVVTSNQQIHNLPKSRIGQNQFSVGWQKETWNSDHAPYRLSPQVCSLVSSIQPRSLWLEEQCIFSTLLGVLPDKNCFTLEYRLKNGD